MSAETLPLFVESYKPGRQEKATARTLASAGLTDSDAALAQLAVEASRAVDLAIAQENAASFAKAAVQLRDTLAILFAGRRLGTDPFDTLVASLADAR